MTHLSACCSFLFETIKPFWGPVPQSQHFPFPSVGLSSDVIRHILSFLDGDRDFALTSLVCRQWSQYTKAEWEKYSKACLAIFSPNQELLRSHCLEELRADIVLIDQIPETIRERRKLFFSRQQELVKMLSFLSHQQLENLKKSHLNAPKVLELLEDAQQSIFGECFVLPTLQEKTGLTLLQNGYRGKRGEFYCFLVPRLDSRAQWNQEDPRREVLKRIKSVSLNMITSITDGQLLMLQKEHYRLHLTFNQELFPIYLRDGTVVNSVKGIKDIAAKYSSSSCGIQ